MAWLAGFSVGAVAVWLIFLLAAAWWALMVERYWYFYLLHARVADAALRRWRYGVKNPLHGRRSRRRILREMTLKIHRFQNLLTGLPGVILLLGLLGSVSGLLQVLNALALPGVAAPDPRALEQAISAAAVPLVAALAVAMTGAYFAAALRRHAARETRLLTDRLRHA